MAMSPDATINAAMMKQHVMKYLANEQAVSDLKNITVSPAWLEVTKKLYQAQLEEIEKLKNENEQLKAAAHKTVKVQLNVKALTRHVLDPLIDVAEQDTEQIPNTEHIPIDNTTEHIPVVNNTEQIPVAEEASSEVFDFCSDKDSTFDEDQDASAAPARKRMRMDAQNLKYNHDKVILLLDVFLKNTRYVSSENIGQEFPMMDKKLKIVQSQLQTVLSDMSKNVPIHSAGRNGFVAMRRDFGHCMAAFQEIAPTSQELGTAARMISTFFDLVEKAVGCVDREPNKKSNLHPNATLTMPCSARRRSRVFPLVILPLEACPLIDIWVGEEKGLDGLLLSQLHRYKSITLEYADLSDEIKDTKKGEQFDYFADILFPKPADSVFPEPA